jgi:nicotinate-nucleotide pyrophosphorylase (carboxylating)
MSTDESSPLLPRQMSAPLDPGTIADQVRIALEEDLGDGDLTARLLPAEQIAQVELITRQEGVICGRAWFDETFHQIDGRVTIAWLVEDGERVGPGERLCRMQGPTRALLTGERVAMNFLQTLSGTATRARQYAQIVADLPVRILDTRKTIPGLRLAQKYAVRCGGCHNHRLGLFDAILIKENHILAAGSIAAALTAARNLAKGRPVEIEVENLDEVEQALAAGSNHMLLDNFARADLVRAVRLVAGRARLEASGGITLETLRLIAETGVDDISIGDITKDLVSLDLSMRFLQ